MPFLSKAQAKINGSLGGRPVTGQSVIRRMERNQRELMEKTIYKKTLPLINAGISSALGNHFVYRIDEEKADNGKIVRKHVLVTEPEEIAKALDQIHTGDTSNSNYYYVTTKEPDVKAISMLLDRAYGRPTESVKIDLDAKFSLKSLAEHRASIKDAVMAIDAEVEEIGVEHANDMGEVSSSEVSEAL